MLPDKRPTNPDETRGLYKDESVEVMLLLVAMNGISQQEQSDLNMAAINGDEERTYDLIKIYQAKGATEQYTIQQIEEKLGRKINKDVFGKETAPIVNLINSVYKRFSTILGGRQEAKQGGESNHTELKFLRSFARNGLPITSRIKAQEDLLNSGGWTLSDFAERKSEIELALKNQKIPLSVRENYQQELELRKPLEERLSSN